MKKTMRILSLLMVLVLCMSLAPLSAFASGEPEEVEEAEEITETEDAPDIMEPVEVEEVLAEEVLVESENVCKAENPTKAVPVAVEAEDAEILSLQEAEQSLEAVEADDLLLDGAEDYRSWAQSDSRWGSIGLGTGGCTVSSAGCLVTSVAKLLIQCGLRSSDNFNVATFVNWLNSNTGFTGSNLYYDAPGRMVSGFVNYGDILSFSTYSSSSYNNTIINWIKAGYHMTINVNGGGHYVAVDEAKSLETGTVYIMDSLYGVQNADITLSSRYGSFNSIHAWTGGNTPTSTAPKETIVNDGVYKICSSIDLSKCVEVANGSTATAANIQLGTYTGSNSQLFTIQKTGDYYKIINVNSGLNVDVAGADKASETNIQQCVETGSNAQLWIFEDAGDGYVYIHSALGNYMDACGGVSTDGTNIQTYTLNKSNAQKFKLTKIADKVCSITYKNASGQTWMSETPVLSGSRKLSAKYPTKSGSYFCGWSFTNNSSTIDARPGDTITVSADVTLYPVYVTHAEAISGKAVPIYNLSDFTDTGYTVTAADYKQKTSTTSGYWTDWSDWSTYAVSASDTVQVETTTLYGYYYFKCANCGTHSHGWGSGACYTWIGGCGSYISSDSWAVMYSTVNWNTTQDWHGTGKYYTTINGERWFKWTDGGTKTGYRYKTYVQTTDEKETILSGCIITAKQTYTVTYNANGGTGAPAAQTKTHDAALTLSSTNPTRTGYTFQGWATTSTATTAEYSAGGSYTKNAGVTLYAVWKQNAPSTAATITTASAVSAPGGTVTVTVSVANNPGIMYLSLTPVYDKNVLTLESVKNGIVFPAEPVKDTNYTWDESANVTGSGTLFTYTFKVKDTAAEGSYAVGVSLRECYNASEQAVSFAIENGTVTVSKCVYGDATGDGLVNGLDLVRLRRYLAAYNYDTKTSTVSISAGTDATGDGSVNGLDLVRLRKYLAAYNYDTNTSTVVLGPTK